MDSSLGRCVEEVTRGWRRGECAPETEAIGGSCRAFGGFRHVEGGFLELQNEWAKPEQDLGDELS